MDRINRRNALKLTGGAGLAGIIAAQHAPAFGQTATVHWLRWNDFVPASDQLLRQAILPEAEKALGMKINLETVNGNDLQPRITAAIQSGQGADLIMLFNNHPHLYAASAADVADLCETIGKAQEGYYPAAKNNSYDGKKWLSVPWAIIPGLPSYRKSWFEEVGFSKFPETWDEYRAAGKKLKAAGRPLGQALGHSFGDPPGYAYPFLWSFGGAEVEQDGKTVAINSKETIESIKYMVGFWKDAYDEGGLAWDDSSNNRAFLSGTISATLNGASIYIEALRKPDSYKTEKGAQMKTDIRHGQLPGGPKGKFAFHGSQSHFLPSYSKNQKAAKEFLTWMHTPANYDKWFHSQKGYATGSTAYWEKSKVWDEDPVMEPFRATGRLGQVPGYPGPTGAKPAEALSKYIIVDMYAKAVQGTSAEEAAKWAEAELKKIYV